ncbi:MAG: bifunctional histidinol-phosphatase/imidazoleglycerol-phosphate dehydratase HisB [Bacteroidaceae bacterium]|nr:bifunctional histidinol-phosphatase/imidazoleglycerol-phosphate dehydratase HisB [Bacteroidaceae bacterium]
MKRALFIDRDGTIIIEPSIEQNEQVDSIEKFTFVPRAISALRNIVLKTDYELIMVSNQDGLGTDSFPLDTFQPLHDLMLRTLEGEGIVFKAQHIDRSFPADNLPTRKPGIAMLTGYMQGDYDLANSYVIGDRETDRQLADNLGAKALILGPDMDWPKIEQILIGGLRTATIHRQTKETDITITINLDGSGKADINTGIGFFDHMLEQIAHHGMIDLCVSVSGDLRVDEHHTIEDTAIVLGQCLDQALCDKRGLQRYGYCLPMDDCLCQTAIDLGGRPWLVWDAQFQREKIGDMPTEMFLHFFKSLSDNAKMNLNIKAEGQNEHHKIEAIFKSFARALRMALKRDADHMQLPSSKGKL